MHQLHLKNKTSLSRTSKCRQRIVFGGSIPKTIDVWLCFAILRLQLMIIWPPECGVSPTLQRELPFYSQSTRTLKTTNIQRNIGHERVWWRIIISCWFGLLIKLSVMSKAGGRCFFKWREIGALSKRYIFQWIRFPKSNYFTFLKDYRLHHAMEGGF